MSHRHCSQDLQQSSKKKREGTVLKSSDSKQRRLDAFLTATPTHVEQQSQADLLDVIDLSASLDKRAKNDKDAEDTVAAVIHCEKAEETSKAEEEMQLHQSRQSIAPLEYPVPPLQCMSLQAC